MFARERLQDAAPALAPAAGGAAGSPSRPAASALTTAASIPPVPEQVSVNTGLRGLEDVLQVFGRPRRGSPWPPATRWYVTGLASSSSVSSGTGVGPGVNRRGFIGRIRLTLGRKGLSAAGILRTNGQNRSFARSASTGNVFPRWRFGRTRPSIARFRPAVLKPGDSHWAGQLTANGLEWGMGDGPISRVVQIHSIRCRAATGDRNARLRTSSRRRRPAAPGRRSRRRCRPAHCAWAMSVSICSAASSSPACRSVCLPDS